MLSRASVNLTLGRIPMYNRRYNNRILAGTALALILAVPLAVMAKNGNPPAATPVAATGAEQTATQAAPAAVATEANEPSAISTGALIRGVSISRQVRVSRPPPIAQSQSDWGARSAVIRLPMAR